VTFPETKGQPMMENVNQAEAFYNGNIAEQQNAFYQKRFVCLISVLQFVQIRSVLSFFYLHKGPAVFL